MSASTHDNDEFIGEPIGDQVLLSEYDDSWPEQFLQLRDLLHASLGATAKRIDHVGSTAVPGLPAKPVIDVQVSVVGLGNENAYRPRIEGLGYPLRYRSPEHRFFRPAVGEPRTVHIHVCETGGREELNKLLFVAYLRSQPEKLDEYAELKRKLARRFRDSRGDYLAGKTDFVTRTIAVARPWAEDTGYRL